MSGNFLSSQLHNAFIGRQSDLDAVTAMFDTSRLVTLVGPAGIGKTRLALEVAARSAGRWDERAIVCDLSGASDVDALCDAVARTLEVPVAGDLAPVLPLALAGHGKVLLLLDNFEQLLPEAAAVVASWLERAEQLHILVTARETVRIAAEASFEVPPLDEAVAFFVDRVAQARGSYEPGDAERKTIEAIVTRLDGIPLALELAAARATMLSIADLHARLQQRFDVLGSGARDKNSRQATMFGAIAWSWELLDDAERRALCACSVFRGGFTVAALEYVLKGASPDGATGDVLLLDVVQALRDKSLLRESPADAEVALRFGMYESIRAFAEAKLEASGDADTMCIRGAEFSLESAERALAADPGSEAVFRRVVAERPNLAAVLEGIPTRKVGDALRVSMALRAAVALDALAPDDGISSSEYRHLCAALGQPCDVEPTVATRALMVRGTKRAYLAQLDEAKEDLRAALAAASDDENLQSAASYRLGYANYAGGELDKAYERYTTAVALFRKQNNAWGEARALQQQAACLQSLNRPNEAIALLEQSLTLCRAHGYKRAEVRALAGTGFHQLESGSFRLAEQSYGRCLDLAREVGATRTAMLVTGYLGVLQFDHDALDDALEYLEASVAEARESGDPRAEGVFSAVVGALRATRNEIDVARVAFDVATVRLKEHPFFAGVADIYRAHLDLALARQSATDGDSEAAKRHLRAAAARAHAARTEGDPPLSARSDDARIALRILERHEQRTKQAPEVPSTDSGQAMRFALANDCSWFALGDGEPVDLSRRRVLRQILAAIAEQHEQHIGQPLSVASLLDAGWPGERMARSAALNRLHVALATLRAHGLRPVLQRHREGYMFDAALRIERHDDA